MVVSICCLITKLCPTLCNPTSSAHQVPLSMEFPRQYTGGGCRFLLWCIFPTQGSNPHLMHWQADSLSLSHQGSPSSHILLFSCEFMSYSLQPHGLWTARLLCPWDFLGKDTGVGCHFLLQRIFLIQGSNLVSCVSCIGME